MIPCMRAWWGTGVNNFLPEQIVQTDTVSSCGPLKMINDFKNMFAMCESMVGHRGSNLCLCMNLPIDTVSIYGNKQLVVIIRNKYRAGEDILIPVEDYNLYLLMVQG